MPVAEHESVRIKQDDPLETRHRGGVQEPRNPQAQVAPVAENDDAEEVIKLQKGFWGRIPRAYHNSARETRVELA